MSGIEISVLALALALDAFSVAAGVGPSICPRWGALRLAATFGLFQAAMPLAGAAAGALMASYVAAYDHWVAFALLELVGGKMIVDAYLSRRPGAEEKSPGDVSGARPDPSCGLSLLSLGVATSIDAFGAGIMLRMVGANLYVACPVIGGVAAALTFLGARLGARSARIFGRKAEVAGGVVLMALGIKMLVSG